MASASAACWLGRSLSTEEWSENTFTYIGEEMDAHFPWLRYGALVAGMGEDTRFSVWWAAVFHFSHQLFPGRDLGAAFASRDQTGWSDCIVFEDSDAMRHTMEHALKMLQILFRGRSDMFFEFELADVATLEPFLLDDYMYMSTVTAFPTKDEMKDRAKARKAREAEAAKAGKDPSEKTGKFWDGFRWVEHTPASQLPSNPATRKERRLYVGNLPQTFDGEQLRIFLNEALRACGAIPAGVDEVVVSSWVSPDKKFAFVELSTVEAATTSLGLSGITCMGCQLKICHPNNYVVGALPGTGPTLPAQYAAAGMLGQVGMPPGAGGAEGGVAAQPGASYAPGYGPDAAAGNEEFINAALAAMASGNPPG